MEENQDKINIPQEDFSDFGEEETCIPELEQDLVEMEKEENLSAQASLKEDESENLPQEGPEEVPEGESEEEPEEESESEIPQDSTAQEPEISKWEELNSDNSVVKKYIIYISKDFVPLVDSLTTDERSAYINDAIQKKIDFEDAKQEKNKKKRLIAHLIITIITFCVLAPVALYGVNKAIMLTFENYKYSQENFEKLYKQRFEKDKAYMRSLQYNLEHRKKIKEAAQNRSK